ncbi:MAG: PfkB family carbohydrate kinase [Chitinophagales bacterium]|nr:PfkB family carbohydrate kinase [Chitinophagales bacterium]OJV27031.1 MAG: sugar kinase [Bacteroidetes bacterium 37-13]HRN93838.1 PfkB family carbohydrate kinase [Chitinophagales bacterium]HRP39584.1 PfkB family carbohydrate kinase [Chitinophagales bacterium]
MSLLTVGTVAFDAIETPFGKTDKIVGGAATYIAWGASFFSKKVNIVSVIGDDFDMKELELLQNRGVDISGIEIKNGKKSFFWSGKYHLDMNTRDTLITDLNVLLEFNPIIPESYQSSDIVLLGNIDPNLQLKVLNQLQNRPKLIILDTMNFWMTPTYKPQLMEVLKKIDVLTINDAEARELSGEYSLVKAAKAILTMGPKYLVIKKGEHGALLFYENNVFFAPALPLEDVFDPTGAGDTFAGGFAGYLDKSRDISFNNMKRAIIYGSAMASFCVEEFGTEKLKTLSHSAIEERVKSFVELVQFDIVLED